MKSVMVQIKECADLSFDILRKNPDVKKNIYRYWESFLTHLLTYVKKKEKKEGQEIIKGISVRNLLKLL